MPDQLPVISINGKTPASAYEGYSYVFISGNTAYCYSSGEEIAPEHQQGNVPEYIPPNENWVGLRIDFSKTDNTLYRSVLEKIGQVNVTEVKDLWDNLKLTILLPDYWQADRLAAAINGLYQLLKAYGVPMDVNEVGNWNSLMDLYRFPATCKIRTVSIDD